MQLLYSNLVTITPSDNALLCDPNGSYMQRSKSAMEIIKTALLKKQIPSDSIDIMCVSLSKNSCRQYNSALKRWSYYCNINNYNMYKASIPEVISFITSCYHEGAQYGTLNSYRSALALL